MAFPITARNSNISNQRNRSHEFSDVFEDSIAANDLMSFDIIPALEESDASFSDASSSSHGSNHHHHSRCHDEHAAGRRHNDNVHDNENDLKAMFGPPTSTARVLDAAVDLLSSTSDDWLFDDNNNQQPFAAAASTGMNAFNARTAFAGDDAMLAPASNDLFGSSFRHSRDFDSMSPPAPEEADGLVPEPTPIEPSRVQVVNSWSPKDTLATTMRHSGEETSSLLQLFRPLVYTPSAAYSSPAASSQSQSSSARRKRTLAFQKANPAPQDHGEWLGGPLSWNDDFASPAKRQRSNSCVGGSMYTDMSMNDAETMLPGTGTTSWSEGHPTACPSSSSLLPANAFEFNETSVAMMIQEQNARDNHAATATATASGAETPTMDSSSSSSEPSWSPARKPKFRTFQEDLWSFRFQELLQFREEHGHCLVPTKYAANLQLSQWVKRQRYHHKLRKSGAHSNLTAERQQSLDDIGFCWDMHSALWEERLHELIAYKNEHGDCNVRCHYTRNPQLAVWVKYQRRQYKLLQEGKPSNMTLERIAKLDEYGFVWNCRAAGGSGGNARSTKARRSSSSNKNKK
mmetsp:Transcript_4648/g.13419  ORF Transcript_4648/g.13419 Transcript_4648/m.13419 type:complete len:573 (+) Transcript_4648:210-1928(+)|eukprot:CAMPEP_0119562274 /NCGR_PEP_ID=MMETSP1352-20130426/19943_1 /TAXON_ID=265584 /ORGANISM="Stauroneis constricta, Strain CCMP1120" /LENGTH=572 /DNA_ID=CAMNT_0007610635 /DNA_START=199 /DNA_END=1917 /DNA_ORIENTATION=+